MIFIETPVFTEDILSLLSEEEYKELQLALLFRPEQGDLIKGTGGLRKIRWRAKGKGKRGGCRVIYFHDKPHDRIYMLAAFSKNVKVDLSPKQAKELSKLVKKELK